jgi:PAS domain S-box-containing protein
LSKPPYIGSCQYNGPLAGDAFTAAPKYLGVDLTEPAAGTRSPTASSAAIRQNDLLAFAEAIPVIVWRTDPQGLNDYFNTTWYDYTGLTVEQSRGTGWTIVIHPDDQSIAQSRWVAAVHDGANYEVEIRMLGRDDNYRWFLVRGRPLPALDGSVAAWFGTATDIDAQKRAVEALAGAKNRAELLAEAETIFERSFATPQVISDLATLSIDAFATFCYYDSADEDGRLTRRAAVHRDPIWQHRFDSAGPNEVPWLRPRLPDPALASGGARFIAPVSDAWLEGIAVDDAQCATLKALDMNSIMAVPLIARGRNFGVLTFGRSGTAPSFTADDLATAKELARRAAATLENAHLYALARDNERRAAAIADAVPQIFWTARADGAIDWYNRRWYEYTGQAETDAPGGGWDAVQHPRDQPDVQREWRRSLVTGKPFEMSHRLRGIDGVYRWFLTRVVPQSAENGTIARWYGATTNVDAERRATLQLAFFAELGQHLTSLPTLDATLDAVVESLVPNFADWAMVELHDDGETYIAAAEHAAAEPRRELHALVGRRNADGTTLAVGDEALRTGRAAIVYSDRPSPDAGAAGFTSAVAVPLVLETGVRGVLTLAMVEAAGAFSDADLPFVQEIARRIAPALARAEIYERERRIAQTFQNAVLPRRLPEIPGLRFDALYEPGKTEALVGGDWFDAFRLADGRIVLTIGDVVGSGLTAATTMGEARQSIRGAAAINPDPAILLDAADRILADSPEDRYATAWAGIVDPIDFSLRYASAGHPQPMVRDRNSNVRMLEGDGLPLGLAGTLAQRRTTFTTFIEPGSLLLLYTDGLIESARDAIRDEALLAAALAGVAPNRRTTARELRDAVLGNEAAHDDVAILLVEFAERLTECGGNVRAKRWNFDVSDPDETRAARGELAGELRAVGMNEENVLVAELIVAELLGNVVRYATGRVDLILDHSADVPVIHIIDGGTGFEHNPRLPADTYAESGRGLYIVAKLAREFTIARAPGGGSHVRVVLETRGSASGNASTRRE